MRHRGAARSGAAAVLRAEVIGGIGGVLRVLGPVHPPLLKWPSVWWWRFARALGYVNARVLLTVLFVARARAARSVWRLTGQGSAGAPQAPRGPGWSPYPGPVPRPAALPADVLSEVAMSKGRVLSEFWSFLRQEKKYWLVPIVVVFVLFGLLIVFSQSSAVAPFIYTLF